MLSPKPFVKLLNLIYLFEYANELVMTLNQIKIFLATVEIGNLTKAAKQVGITQSAASSAISALEDLYQIKLFKREGRSIVLSDQGQQFLPAAKHFFQSSEIAKKTLVEIGGKAVGNLQISASQTIANYWLPPVLAKFQRTNPDVNLVITMSNTAGVEASVLNGSAEIGFVEGEIISEQILLTDVDYDQPVLVASDELFDLLNQNYNERNIRNLPWIVREEGSGTRRLLEYFMKSRKIKWDEVNIALELPSNEAVRQAVEAGAGITLLSEYVVNSSVKSGVLKLIPVELPVRKFRTITHKNRQLSNVSQTFLETLARRFAR